MLQVISESPGDDAAGLVHSNRLVDTKSQGVGDQLPPNLETVPFPNPLPLTLTTVPPSIDPAVGCTEDARPDGNTTNLFALDEAR